MLGGAIVSSLEAVGTAGGGMVGLSGSDTAISLVDQHPGIPRAKPSKQADARLDHGRTPARSRGGLGAGGERLQGLMVDRPPHRTLSLFAPDGRAARRERVPATGSDGGSQPRERPRSVSQLLSELRVAIGRDFQRVLVEGEVQAYKIWRGRAGQRAYFDLKDAGATIQCTITSDVLARLSFQPEDGMKVLIRGNVAEHRSRLQIVVKRIKPSGEGELALAFAQLREKLEQEGLFAPERKRALPLLPRRVGIVTSTQGAALRDMIKVLRARLPGVSILVAPTLVQGADAAPRVATALRRLDEHGSCDVLIVGRGGGSLEDLWAFNTPEVVRAVAASKTPVVSGVGHETDVTLCDLVADVRAATPSHAAEHAVPVRQDLDRQLLALRRRLDDRARARVGRAELALRRASARLSDPRLLLGPADRRLRGLQTRLDDAFGDTAGGAQRRLSRLKDRLAPLSPDVAVQDRRRRVAAARARLDAQAERSHAAARRRLATLAAKLHALSPLQVLDRGYALVTRDDGALVPAARGLSAGDVVDVRFGDGRARARIEDVDVDTGEDRGD
jgi:exodeoxyribonuclease VII large subunit